GSLTLLNTGNQWTVSPEGEKVYLNGKKIEMRTQLEIGDILFWPFMTIRLIEEDLIQITSTDSFHSKLPLTEKPRSEMSKKYPIY
ncbi:hypothetical protein, partial [Klebsiella pneumoniae]